MSQTLSIEIINGTMTLDATTLQAAHINHKARVLVQENSILILPAETESGSEDVIAQTFGLFRVPVETARYLAEDKELEYDL